jgi:hypothetical protein
VYLGIFASIYSQPTVDEYHKAKESGKPILIYLRKCAKRDSELEDFIRAELQPSHKYQEFSTTEELVSHLPDVRRALDAEVQKHQRQAYLDALVAQTELLELAGIVDTGEQDRPKLQDIYIALSAAEEVEERDEHQPKRERERERERPIKITRRVTIEQALREHRNLMILGDPGAGKSTLLRYLTLVAAQGKTDGVGATLCGRPEAGNHTGLPLPILIRLSSFAQSKQSFIEYFESYAKTQLHVSLGEKFFERALEDGQAIVCLDGLDEVSQPAQRIDVRNAITALTTRYPRNRFIVTSRVAGYDSASLDKRAFAHHAIVPFGEKEIQSFVEKWYAAREREPEQAKTRAANLFNDLKANERLLKLAENPLTLTIIALVHQRARAELPEARVELYDRCAETLIEEWDKWKGLAPDDRARPYYQLRRRLLERAAYWMHIESQDADVAQISKRALEMKVAEFLVEDETLNLSEDTARIEAKQFVALATSRTGILVEREQGAVSFIHLTFQEYFAASDLYWRYRKSPDAIWQAIQPHLYDSHWLEVILLLLGRLNDDGDTPSIIVEKILREHDKFDDVIHRDLFLAARCLADGVKVSESLQNVIVEKLSRFAGRLQPRYEPLRRNAIEILGILKGDKRAGDVLLTLAQDEKVDMGERVAAAQALGQFGYTDDAISLLLVLARDEKAEVWVQYAVAQAFVCLGHTDDAVRLLMDLVQSEDVSLQVQVNTLQVLKRMEYVGETLIQGLLALVQNEKIALVAQIDVAEMLGQLGYKDDVVYALLELAQDEKFEYQARCISAQALGRLGRTADATDVLLALAQSEKTDSWVRCDAAEALGLLGQTNNAVHLLLGLAQDEKITIWVRHKAVLALGQLGRTSDAVRLLLDLVQNTKDGQFAVRIRRDATLALGQLGQVDDDVVHRLLSLVEDKTEEALVRRDAAEALGRLGHIDEALHWLLSFAQDKTIDWVARIDATEGLGKFGKKEPHVVLVLLELTSDKDYGVRNAAYSVLNQVVGNLRYAEVDNGQKRIKRISKKIPKPKSKIGNRKSKNSSCAQSKDQKS